MTDTQAADRVTAVTFLNAMWHQEHGNVVYGWMRDEETATLSGKRDNEWAVKAAVKARLAAAPPPPAGSDGWLPIAEGGGIDEEVLVGFFRPDGTEYGRKRIARLQETGWPVRITAWDQQQKVCPTHFQRIRSTPPVAPRG